MLSLVPFGVLLAACGIEAACAGSKMARAGLAVLLIAMPVQFAAFSADYFSGYRVRSSYWFEENLREAVDATLAQRPRRTRARKFGSMRRFRSSSIGGSGT